MYFREKLLDLSTVCEYFHIGSTCRDRTRPRSSFKEALSGALALLTKVELEQIKSERFSNHSAC